MDKSSRGYVLQLPVLRLPLRAALVTVLWTPEHWPKWTVSVGSAALWFLLNWSVGDIERKLGDRKTVKTYLSWAPSLLGQWGTEGWAWSSVRDHSSSRWASSSSSLWGASWLLTPWFPSGLGMLKSPSCYQPYRSELPSVDFPKPTYPFVDSTFTKLSSLIKRPWQCAVCLCHAPGWCGSIRKAVAWGWNVGEGWPSKDEWKNSSGKRWRGSQQ